MSSVAIKTSRAQKEQFDWPMPLNVATLSCREGVTLRNVEKIPCNVAGRVAESKTDFYFSQRLRQQKVARNVCSRVCYTRQYFVQLVSQEKLPSVTVPSATVATIFLSITYITVCGTSQSSCFFNLM